MAWKTPLPGPGASSPIVSGDKIFITAYSGYGLDATAPGEMNQLKRHAICLNRADGRVRWTREVAPQLPVEPYTGRYIPLHGYASSTPVSDGERVYFFFGNAGVHAFSHEGKPLWTAKVGDGFHEWGSGASPVLYRNLVIVNASMESDSLIALDRASGREVWRVERGFPRAWNTPALVRSESGRTELVVSTNGRLRAFDPETGRELWSCQGIKAAELCPSIVSHRGVIYVLGAPSGKAMAVRAGGQGDVSQSHVLWRLDKGSNVSSPVYHDGHLYWMNDSRGIAYGVKAETGEVVYEERFGPKPDRFFASPVLVDGKLYYQSRGRGLYVIAAKPAFELLAHNVIAPPEEIFNGSPAVSNGQLLLRSDRALYCIRGPAK